jgi:hypothetical protein
MLAATRPARRLFLGIDGFAFHLSVGELPDDETTFRLIDHSHVDGLSSRQVGLQIALQLLERATNCFS